LLQTEFSCLGKNWFYTMNSTPRLRVIIADISHFKFRMAENSTL
jgi:hypothetical protein